MSTMTMSHPVSVRSQTRGSAATGRTVGAGEPRATRMRLTRRGRVVLAVLAALLAFGIAMVADQALASGPADQVVHGTVHVAPGDSLWSIASDIAGDRDVRDVVAQIERLNALSSSEILVGQELIVPAVSD